MAIDEWVFSERDRRIMKRKIIDGITFEALAEEEELSVLAVKNIVKKHKPIILSKLY